MPQLHRTTSKGGQNPRTQYIMGGIAAAVLLACAAWLIYYISSGRPVTEIQATTPVQLFMVKSAALFEEERLPLVTIIPDHDTGTVKITGRVPNQAALNELRTSVEQIVAETAKGQKLEVQWDVGVGG
jgi:hypothetical protein